MSGGAAPVLVLAAVLALAVALGAWWRRRQGVVRPAARRRPAASPAHGAPGGAGVDWAAHGVRLGPHRTFVQLSAAVCAPCRSTARVLGDVAARTDGVVHHELDVDDHLDLVLDLGVLRTPTVLVLDGAGRETARASGAMTRAQALDALAVGAVAAARPIEEPS
ncbi:thioredoxin domain-containing protein [Cellulosimicrobium marinum]|uniref:thioredoxin domain-containing protein n=1 Tax=Cellulosimicrobium marinum TaxID=1638992 RepID=UPI001E2E10C3|nr:thioredoxin domain-containing protein [Cellulosimicrobium marinum]MCB7136290.1 thioredoxin [Cellulosimicrobium marinum]